jgi:hypothetical protein
MAVHIRSKGQHACYVSDLIPTSSHLDPTWAMGYDLDPVETIAQRKRFYSRAIPENLAGAVYARSRDTDGANWVEREEQAGAGGKEVRSTNIRD